MDPLVVIGLNAVIMAVTEGSPRILTVRRADHSLAGELQHRPDIFQPRISRCNSVWPL